MGAPITNRAKFREEFQRAFAADRMPDVLRLIEYYFQDEPQIMNSLKTMAHSGEMITQSGVKGVFEKHGRADLEANAFFQYVGMLQEEQERDFDRALSRQNEQFLRMEMRENKAFWRDIVRENKLEARSWFRDNPFDFGHYEYSPEFAPGAPMVLTVAHLDAALTDALEQADLGQLMARGHLSEGDMHLIQGLQDRMNMGGDPTIIMSLEEQMALTRFAIALDTSNPDMEAGIKGERSAAFASALDLDVKFMARRHQLHKEAEELTDAIEHVKRANGEMFVSVSVEFDFNTNEFRVKESSLGGHPHDYPLGREQAQHILHSAYTDVNIQGQNFSASTSPFSDAPNPFNPNLGGVGRSPLQRKTQEQNERERELRREREKRESYEADGHQPFRVTPKPTST